MSKVNLYVVAQRWDAARNNPADRGVWNRADSLSFDAAANASTRSIIRRRARFLVANNAYAHGAANAIVAAVCGSMPRLQLNCADSDTETLTRIENDFCVWAERVELAEKLRTMRLARFVDGESFAAIFSNPDVGADVGVQTDVFCFDCDRVVAPAAADENGESVDGVYIDRFGVPVKYRVLNYNPGDVGAVQNWDNATIYPARNICHWFKKLYPEQRRGVSELAPALELFNLIDRYSKAVVQASETAADLAMVLTSDAADDEGAFNIDDEPEGNAPIGENPFAQIPWQRGMTITVPQGWDAKQINAEQPTSNYAMLVNEILSQIGSSIGVPKLLMKNSAENYNYSSARVDLQQFQTFVKLDRQTLVQSVLNPVFRAWWAEYRAVNSLEIQPRVQWYFDGFFHVDPLKEANAQTIRLEAGLTSLADEYGARGRDWEQEVRQIAREKAYIKKLEEEYGVSFGNNDAKNFSTSDSE